MTSIAEIQAAVADEFGTPLMEMTSHRRGRWMARPRQVAMYLSRELTPLSLPAIGRHFRRDHTTVIHAIKVVPKLALQDANFGGRVAVLREKLTPTV